MEREEFINVIQKAVGNKKLVLPSRLIEIGQYRGVCAVSKKFVYMDSMCYIEVVYKNGQTIKSPRKLPIYKVHKSELSSKVDLDCLETEDLEKVFNGIMNFCLDERDKHLPSLQDELRTCEENVKRLKAFSMYLDNETAL
jgi:hypothetical protein